jgi:hypothetical protein
VTQEMRATDFLLVFAANRADFYAIAAEKLPVGPLRDAVRDAGRSVALPQGSILWDGCETLLLRDLYKKPQFGRTLAKTAISVRLLLESAQMIEEGGVLLCRCLRTANPVRRAELTEAEAEFAERLLRLVRIEDALRYHRLRLVSN